MIKIGKELAESRYILRSGGAKGADTAFETGCDLVNGKKEIYLPWKNFNGNSSDLYDLPLFKDAMEISKKYHPNWGRLSYGGKKLQTRNVFQVLGADLKTPTEFIICWTDKYGGTQQALRIAKSFSIPVFNLFKKK